MLDIKFKEKINSEQSYRVEATDLDKYSQLRIINYELRIISTKHKAEFSMNVKDAIKMLCFFI